MPCEALWIWSQIRETQSLPQKEDDSLCKTSQNTTLINYSKYYERKRVLSLRKTGAPS